MLNLRREAFLPLPSSLRQSKTAYEEGRAKFSLSKCPGNAKLVSSPPRCVHFPLSFLAPPSSSFSCLAPSNFLSPLLRSGARRTRRSSEEKGPKNNESDSLALFLPFLPISSFLPPDYIPSSKTSVPFFSRNASSLFFHLMMAAERKCGASSKLSQLQQHAFSLLKRE